MKLIAIQNIDRSQRQRFTATRSRGQPGVVKNESCFQATSISVDMLCDAVSITIDQTVIRTGQTEEQRGEAKDAHASKDQGNHVMRGRTHNRK